MSNNAMPKSYSRGDLVQSQGEGHGLTFHNFVLGQSLASVCHDPRGSYVSEFSTSELVPPQASGQPPIKPAQFKPYLDSIAEPYRVFLESAEVEKIPSPKNLQKSGSIKTLDKYPKIEKVSTSEVPESYFKDDFSLEEALSHAISEEAVSPTLHVQKLTHYLDLVEMDLLRHISLRRDSFFEALTNMHGLHNEVRKSVEDIDTIRTGLNQVDEVHVKGSLKVTQLCTKRDNLTEVYRKLQLIANVRQTQPTIQILLSKGDYGTALDLIHSTQQVLATDLAGVQSFKHMALQLREMAVLIEKMMQAEFVQFSMGASAGLVADALLGSSTGSDAPTLEERVAPLVNGLLRMNKLHVALQEYRTAVQADFKTLVRRCVTRTLSRSEQVGAPGSPSLPQTTWHDTKYAIGRLTMTEFFSLLRTVFTELENQLQRVKGVHSLVLKGLSEVPTTVEYREQVTSISSDALYGVCEESQDRVARLLRSRSEQHARLVATELASLYDTCMAFAATVEGIAGRQCHGLRPTVHQQAKQFLDTFHSNRIASLGLLLDNEDWSQAEIVSEFQDITDQISAPTPEEEAARAREMPSSPPQRPTTPGSPAPTTPLSPQQTPTHADTAPSTPTSQRAAISSNPATPSTPASPPQNSAKNVINVDGESYKVVNTSLMLLKIVSDYLHCMSLIPALSTDVVHRVVEILQLFNSRTLQLVLGAGARKLVQLKTITAKHLGLASQCLGLVIALIPHIRMRIAPYLPERHHVLLADLDRVLVDYADHREQISNKFVSILRERIQLHGKTATTIDYKDESLPNPSPPIAALTKDAVTLHRLLLELIPPHQLQSVFARIYRDLNTMLPEHFARIELNSRNARRRMHDDITYLLTSLRKLAVVSDPGTALEDWFKSKYPGS